MTNKATYGALFIISSSFPPQLLSPGPGHLAGSRGVQLGQQSPGLRVPLDGSETSPPISMLE